MRHMNRPTDTTHSKNRSLLSLCVVSRQHVGPRLRMRVTCTHTYTHNKTIRRVNYDTFQVVRRHNLKMCVKTKKIPLFVELQCGKMSLVKQLLKDSMTGLVSQHNAFLLRCFPPSHSEKVKHSSIVPSLLVQRSLRNKVFHFWPRLGRDPAVDVLNRICCFWGSPANDEEVKQK